MSYINIHFNFMMGRSTRQDNRKLKTLNNNIYIHITIQTYYTTTTHSSLRKICQTKLTQLEL